MRTLNDINNEIAKLNNEKEIIFIAELKAIFELSPTYSISVSCSMESNDEGGSEVYMTDINDIEEIEINEKDVEINESSSFEIKYFLERLQGLFEQIDSDYLYNKFSDGNYIKLNYEIVNRL